MARPDTPVPPASGLPAGARGYERFRGRVGRTIDDSVPAWDAEPRPPAGAPNIVVVVVDDLGYSDIGPYGSEIPTPNIDRLAGTGITLTNYHTSPVCSPARAALLTGVNPHRAGFATVANSDPGYPGYAFELDDDVITLPEVLRDNGYATFALGKWHLSRDALLGDGASRKSWPLQRGFDRYYGCLEGFTSYFAPHRMWCDNSPIDVEDYPDDYYLTDDLTDQAIGMIRGLRAHDADRPFFLYFAHNAVHAPLGAKAEDIARYRGDYDRGWDVLRSERFERQKRLGLFGPGTTMVERNTEGPRLAVPEWDSLPADERARQARLMEVYAAMVESIDHSLGRISDAIADYGELDNTIIVFTSDNGGSPEGGVHGTRSYFAQFIHGLDLPADWNTDVPLDVDLIGGPRSMAHYPRGWAMASNTPFRLYKGSTFAGGVRTPCIVSWPCRLAGNPQRGGGLRGQFEYVTDIYPTLLEAAGIDRPTTRHGIPVTELDGTSFLPIFADEHHPETRMSQYSEFRGHRGYYREGFKILTLHAPKTPIDDAEWQLYDIVADPTETTDVADRHPALVRELASEWEQQAWANTVFPLNNGSPHARVLRRPDDARASEPVRLFPGTPALERWRSAALIALRSTRVEAVFEHHTGDEGVLVAHGDQGGGYVLYVAGDRLALGYNEYGLEQHFEGPEIGTGTVHATLNLHAAPRFCWDLTLDVGGTTTHLGRRRMLLGFAPFTGISVGADRGGPVCWSIHERHRTWPYRGRLHHVTYVPGERAEYHPAHEIAAERPAAALHH